MNLRPSDCTGSSSKPLVFPALCFIMAVIAPTRRCLLRDELMAVRMYSHGSHRSLTQQSCIVASVPNQGIRVVGYLTSGCTRASVSSVYKLRLFVYPIPLSRPSFPSGLCPWRSRTCHTDIFLTPLITRLRGGKLCGSRLQ